MLKILPSWNQHIYRLRSIFAKLTPQYLHSLSATTSHRLGSLLAVRGTVRCLRCRNNINIALSISNFHFLPMKNQDQAQMSLEGAGIASKKEQDGKPLALCSAGEMGRVGQRGCLLPSIHQWDSKCSTTRSRLCKLRGNGRDRIKRKQWTSKR